MRTSSNNNVFKDTLLGAVIIALLLMLLKLYRFIFPPDTEKEGKKRQDEFINDTYLPYLSEKFERFYRCLGFTQLSAKERALNNAVRLPMYANIFLKHMGEYPSQWFFEKLWENEKDALKVLGQLNSTEEFLVFDRLVYEMSGKSVVEILEQKGDNWGGSIWFELHSDSMSIASYVENWKGAFNLMQTVWIQNSQKAVYNGCSPFSPAEVSMIVNNI